MEWIHSPPNHFGELTGTVKMKMKGLYQDFTARRVVITGELLKKERCRVSARDPLPAEVGAIHLYSKAWMFVNKESRLVDY